MAFFYILSYLPSVRPSIYPSVYLIRFEVQGTLDAQKEEFARREEAFRRREDGLRQKDLELQGMSLQFTYPIPRHPPSSHYTSPAPHLSNRWLNIFLFYFFQVLFDSICFD